MQRLDVATSEQMKGKTWQEQRTHCIKGHEFTGYNVRTYRGYRVCRQCKREEAAKHWKRTRPLVPFSRAHKQLSLLPYLKGSPRANERKNRIKRANALIISLKDSPCVDCNGRFHYSAMDFDHMPGFTKVDTVSNMTSKGKSRRVLLEEIAKCELVCSNCHRVRTFTRRTTPP